MSRSLMLALSLAACTSPTDPPGSPSTTPSTPPDSPTGAAVIELAAISWFQVVDVPVIRDGEEIPASVRPAPLVADRGALLRVFVDVPADWEPQEVEARVQLTNGARVETYTHTRDLASSSSNTDPLSGFLVEVPADAVQPDATYTLSLWSADGQPLARFPADGEAQLAPQVTGPIKIHLVPFEIAGFVPDTSGAVIQGYADAVHAVYPTTEVEITVGEVVPDRFGLGALTPDTFDQLLVDVGMLQEAASFPPTEYWYGLVSGAATREDYCDSCATGSSEEGNGNPTRPFFAIGAAFGDQRSEDTLIHELGHLHQLPHAPCGDPSDVDPSFPYPGGTIGVEGYDVRTDTFVPADALDMMGYCYPRWISDHNYAKLVDWVKIGQSW